MQKQASGGGKTDRFRSLMVRHRLKPADVARILGREVRTVYGWRVGKPHAIPDALMELLEMKLSSRTGTGAAG